MALQFNFNATQLEASIQNVADRAMKGASEEMRKTAIKIRDLAREYAPFKTGTLERAIEYETIKDINRRNEFVVFVNVDMLNPGGHLVGDYAWIMEQQLHPFGRASGKVYLTLGPDSKAKDDGSGKVGGRFLERAMKDGSAQLVADARAAVSRVLSNTRLVNLDYERNRPTQE